MTRTYDWYTCEVCGHHRERPGICPYCKLEMVLVNEEHELELELVTAGSQRQITSRSE